MPKQERQLRFWLCKFDELNIHLFNLDLAVWVNDQRQALVAKRHLSCRQAC